MWIDSHFHPTHERTEEGDSADAIIARAKEAGVEGMLAISCEITGDFRDVLEVARTHENVWCSVGTHPHEAGKPEEQAITLEKLAEIANSDPNIVGIGETGLDYYYDNSPRDLQQESFRKHIRACLKTALPLIVHSRDAEEDTMRIIREEGGQKAGLRGVMHCFSSGPWLAEEALEEGFYLSFSGIVTFKKAQELQEIAKNTPLERILVETDAPFLAPEPHRGRANEPALVVHTGQKLAELHGISQEKLATYSKNNFFNLFNKAKTA
ncbi:MAG: TatD family hydrolase [Rhodospirillales bacterium]|nr:TatD family hydrolase [Alphaproteobacteria bacterium]USO03354.1 MAG: TatD family hydrolase [Rhodospirillales bacterium]